MKEKLEMLRGEQIKGNFLLYGHTVFALHCTGKNGEHAAWRGFHAWNNLHQRYD